MNYFLKYSIRRRIMLIFIGLMAIMLMAIWAVNNWWLGRYYIDQKRREMEQAYDEIDAAVKEKSKGGQDIGDVITRELQQEWKLWSESARSEIEEGMDSDEESLLPRASDETRLQEEESAIESPAEFTLLGMIRDYGEKNNINIVLIDSNTGTAILGFGRDSDYLMRKVQRYVLGKESRKGVILKRHENYVLETNFDFRSQSHYMECWGFLSDNTTLFIMSTPLTSIQESVILTNRFITFVGISALGLGSLLMYFVTRRVTDPLLRLAVLSERMSELDFEAKYEGDHQDEIGVLGRSMNTLSDKLKETIGALQEANRQLQNDIEKQIQIDEMRKEFIANVSHELKTPIALIQGYAEGLTEGMAEDAESRDYYCEVIMDEAAKMNKMVKQLLTLSALEFGNDAPAWEKFDLAELIQELLNSAKILIRQKEAQILWEDNGPLPVKADEFKIEEVITNYLNNAINHLDGEKIIRIRTERRQGKIVFCIYNTGKPIPEEDIPKLWTKFYKVDKARTRSYGGSGIGLSIVKAIMDAHGQECGVRNVDGGVEFWFTLEAV